MYTCAMCSEKNCKDLKEYKKPLNCPSRQEENIESIMKKYLEEDNYKLAYNAALVESEGYGEWTRLKEIIEFAKKCEFKTLGIAFCIGLSKEAKTVVKILKKEGFNVESLVCKNGSIPKEFLLIKDEEKVRPGTPEMACNSIGQAFFLNEAYTDLNIILGLCVGHDSLFIKYSKAPVTVLGVKDRVLAHNPLGAIYLADGYYQDKS
ncbi:MAG: DUF1847 domain-containing protein [Desulfitobacteriia bacterium]